MSYETMLKLFGIILPTIVIATIVIAAIINYTEVLALM